MLLIYSSEKILLRAGRYETATIPRDKASRASLSNKTCN